jgi:hypothetical protein
MTIGKKQECVLLKANARGLLNTYSHMPYRHLIVDYPLGKSIIGRFKYPSLIKIKNDSATQNPLFGSSDSTAAHPQSPVLSSCGCIINDSPHPPY